MKDRLTVYFYQLNEKNFTCSHSVPRIISTSITLMFEIKFSIIQNLIAENYNSYELSRENCFLQILAYLKSICYYGHNAQFSIFPPSSVISFFPSLVNCYMHYVFSAIAHDNKSWNLIKELLLENLMRCFFFRFETHFLEDVLLTNKLFSASLDRCQAKNGEI